MTEFFISGRQAGKTHAIIEIMSKDPHNHYMICSNQVAAEHSYKMARAKFPDVPWERNSFTTLAAVRRGDGSGMRPRRIMHFDNVGHILASLIDGSVGVIAGVGRASASQEGFLHNYGETESING